jgi:hypothetical protein
MQGFFYFMPPDTPCRCRSIPAISFSLLRRAEMAGLHSHDRASPPARQGARVQHKPLRYIKLYTCWLLLQAVTLAVSHTLQARLRASHLIIINAVFFLRFLCKSFFKIIFTTSFCRIYCSRALNGLSRSSPSGFTKNLHTCG